MTQRIPPMEEERRRGLFLEAAVRDWRRVIQGQAQTAVDKVDAGAITPASLQGLVSSVSPGPNRHRPARRLDSVKRYLAWRKHRAAEGEPWFSLAETVTEDLTAFEEVARRLLGEASDRRALPELEPSEHVCVLRDLHLRLTVIYLHALAGYYEDRRT